MPHLSGATYIGKCMNLGKRQLVIVLSALLCLGFFATTIANYLVSRASIKQAIIESELPLTSDNIYSEIQKDLIRPIFISSTMASDTFLRDWVIGGEKDVSQMTHYLAEISKRYGAHTSFFISDQSRIYYQTTGILKRISESEPIDKWYFRVRDMKEPYEINLDPDMAHRDELTIFVNYRVLDYNGRFIGATGIGLSVNAVRDLVNQYETRYKRTIYFSDAKGNIALVAKDTDPSYGSILKMEGLSKLALDILHGKAGAFEYQAGNATHLLNVRYIPELNWYLFVEKREDEAMSGIRHTLYINLLISFGVTVIVAWLVSVVIGRYQTRLEDLALTDKLTGLANRQALDLMFRRDLADSRRDKSGVAVLLLDLDHFKSINDKYGHLAGDAVLQGIAKVIREHLREGDFVARWGGEEFLILLRHADEESATLVAEKIRTSIEQAVVPYIVDRFRLTASVGVAVWREGDTQDSLISRADDALYKAKEQGRNRVSSA